MTTFRGRVLFATVSMLSMMCAGSVLAQTGARPTAAPDNSNRTEEIVVTAQKREQTLQQVPVAVSAFTSVERDKVGIDSVQDITNFTPGLSYNTGNDRVTLRGIGRYTNQLSADSSVGVYEDGSFTTFTVKVGEDTLFVDRVEVLRGPQGTLYGRNSIGGAINIISRQPTNDPYAEVRAQFDTYGYHLLEGAASGPVTDHVQYRVAAYSLGQTNGYFNNLNGLRNEGNNRNEWYVEGQLRGDWGTHFDWWIKAYGGGWQNIGGNAGGRISNSVIVGPDGHSKVANPVFGCNGTPGSPAAPFVGSLYSNPLVPSLGAQNCAGVTNINTINPTGLNPGNKNIRDYYAIYPQSQDVQDYHGAILKLNGHFSGFDVRYLGSVNRYSYQEHEEWGEGQQLSPGVISYKNFTGATIFPDSQLLYKEIHWTTQNELDIVSSGTGPFQWVVGGYNFNEGYKQPEEINLPGQAQLATPLYGDTFTPAPANPNRDVYRTTAQMGAETFAGFAQIDYKITSAWKTTLGIRYTYDAKYGLDESQIYEFLPIFGSPLQVAITGITAATAAAMPAQRGATAPLLDPRTGLFVRKLSGDWSGTTGVAGLQYEPDRDTNVYVKYSRGYKSGGFNAGSNLALNPETNPENSNDYQFGIKKNFGRKLQINLDLFYDQYYNAQVPIGVVGTGGVINTQFYNLPEARSDGVEVEAVWSPTHSLQFMLDYGFNDTSIIRSGCVVDSNDPTATKVGATPGGCAGGAQNLKGNALPNAPRNKVALNGVYTWDLSSGTLSLSGSYIWRDEQYGAIFQRPQYNAPSWDQVDLRAEFKPHGGHWTLIAYGKNIFDNVGYINGAGAVAQYNGTFLKQFGLTPPALGGVEVQYKF